MGILWVNRVCYIWRCPNFFLLQGCLWFGCLCACSELMYRPCFSLTCVHTHTYTFLMELNTLWLSLFCWLPSHQLALLSLHLIIFTLRPLQTLWNNMWLMLAVRTKQTPTEWRVGLTEHKHHKQKAQPVKHGGVYRLYSWPFHKSVCQTQP